MFVLVCTALRCKKSAKVAHASETVSLLDVFTNTAFPVIDQTSGIFCVAGDALTLSVGKLGPRLHFVAQLYAVITVWQISD